MERRVYARSVSTSSVTSLSYQPLKREIISGHEDGSMKCWEGDSGELTSTLSHHKGWVTDLLFWQEGKVLFSSSLDGTIVQWSPAGVAFNTIDLGSPVFSLAWSSRKGQLIAGQQSCIRVLNQAGEVASNGFPLIDRKALQVPGHKDIVKCLSCLDNKIISAGYDHKLIIYEVATVTGDEGPLKCIFMNPKAHDAGITCLQVTKDTDSSTWIITGSLDKRVKIWTGDGKIIHTLSFSAAVTGVCYVPEVHLVWVATTNGSVTFFEPKSGSNVSEFVDLLELNDRKKNSLTSFKEHTFQLLKYVPDTHEVLGSTSRKDLVTWRSSMGAASCVRRMLGSHIETISYTCKSPLLLFTGSFDGSMLKWERLQMNPFDFQHEELGYKDKLLVYPDGLDEEERRVVRKEKRSQNGFLKTLYVETLDLLVGSCVDGKILVWGYDKAVVGMLRNMQKNGALGTGDRDSDAVTNRVAGFACLHILGGHTDCVTGLALVESIKDGTLTSGPYLLSTGWDLTVCVWDLNTARLVAKLERCLGGGAADRKGEESSDNVVTDLSYCSKHGTFAYSSSDKTTYLRRFSLQPSKMELLAILVGHTGEVTQVRWNEFCDKWVTSSEDSTVRIWSIDGSRCEQVVTVEGPVSVLTIDSTNGFILAGTQTIIRLFDTDLQPLITYRGHTDLIRAIVHVPEWNQYVSSSWDATVRIWGCHHFRKTRESRLDPED
ncbi:hypothetical protein EMCRGX_G011374 [Ephydatia muelleri]